MKIGLRGSLWIFPLLTLLVCSCDVHKKLAQLHYKEAMSKFDRGDFTNSLVDFTAAIAQNPQFAEAYLYRGYDQLVASNYVVAIKDIDRAISLGQGNEYAFVYRGYCLEGLGDNVAAATNYTEAIRLEPNSVQAYKYRGALRTTLRDYDGALADLNQAESLDPKDEEIFGDRAELHLWRQEYEAGITDATSAITMNSKDDYSLEQRGLCKMHLKDYAGAQADFDAAIALDPHSADHFTSRSLGTLMAGDIPAAEADLAQATMLCPTNLFTLNVLAIVKVKKQDPVGAADAFAKAAGWYPKSSEIFYGLGCVQNDLRQYEPALKSLRRVVELDPRTYYPRYRIWVVRSHLGETAAATTELKADLAAREDDHGHPWELCISRFLAGDLAEPDLIAQADATAKRPTDIKTHQCEAYYYAGMKRLLAGDKSGATALFEMSVATKEDNADEYNSAQAELRELKQ